MLPARFLPLLFIASASAAELPAPAARQVDFVKDIQPIFQQACVSCHGAEKQKSGFRLDIKAAALRGGVDFPPAIHPGQSSESPLIRFVAGLDPKIRMPSKGDPLTPEQISLLRAWIDQGAIWPDNAPGGDDPRKHHWSYQPLHPVTPPSLAQSSSEISNPIDAFIEQKLSAAGLPMSPPADARTLCRRVYFDLIGLPPTPEELDAFIESEIHNPKSAMADLVDHLLSSPRYGERWAQHWLDVIRWAETAGFEVNAPRPNAHPYRDYVIRAFNEDKPYDRFMFEQVAGDTVEEDAALGFLTAGPANQPGQIGKDISAQRMARADEQDEIIKTVGGAFLWLTVGCARCHDHKFDPITQKDYYAMQAVFAGTYYGDRRIRGKMDEEWRAQLPVVEKKLAVLKRDLEARREQLHLRPAMEPKDAVETFSTVEAQAVRMQIHATLDNLNASITELEIYSATEDGGQSQNIALSSHGSVADASSYAFANQTRHPENLNDGKLENPWEAKTSGAAWVMIRFAKAERINRVHWVSGKGAPADYAFEAQLPDGTWKEIASSSDRMPGLNDMRAAKKISLRGCSPEDVQGIAQGLATEREIMAEHKRLKVGPQVFAAAFRDPEPTHRLRRGDPMQPQEEVVPDAPALFGGLHLAADAPETERRVALGKWLADPQNPLPARVMVNRIWQHHFGRGLVDTPSDFGAKGSAPTHPELLDWLAREFIASGWSVKHLQRLIMSSRTYQQSSTIADFGLRIADSSTAASLSRPKTANSQVQPVGSSNPKSEIRNPQPSGARQIAGGDPKGEGGSLSQLVDADCRLLWRFPPRRLEAEAVCDSILALSGQLDLTVPAGLGADEKVVTTASGDRHRMIYETKRRMVKPDVFGALDCPDGGQMTAQRTSSITPVQAAGLLNSEFILRQAKFLAQRVQQRAGDDAPRQAQETMLMVLGRPPSAEEKEALVPFIRQHGLAQLCRVLFNSNEFVFLP